MSDLQVKQVDISSVIFPGYQPVFIDGAITLSTNPGEEGTYPAGTILARAPAGTGEWEAYNPAMAPDIILGVLTYDINRLGSNTKAFRVMYGGVVNLDRLSVFTQTGPLPWPLVDQLRYSGITPRSIRNEQTSVNNL